MSEPSRRVESASNVLATEGPPLPLASFYATSSWDAVLFARSLNTF